MGKSLNINSFLPCLSCDEQLPCIYTLVLIKHPRRSAQLVWSVAAVCSSSSWKLLALSRWCFHTEAGKLSTFFRFYPPIRFWLVMKNKPLPSICNPSVYTCLNCPCMYYFHCFCFFCPLSSPLCGVLVFLNNVYKRQLARGIVVKKAKSHWLDIHFQMLGIVGNCDIWNTPSCWNACDRGFKGGSLVAATGDRHLCRCPPVGWCR